MSARSRKSIKLAPGVKLNLNKKSASVTIGNKYAHVTKSSTGRTTTSINPVKGLSYTHVQTTGRANKSSNNSLKSQASIPIDTNSTTTISKNKNNKWLLWILLIFLPPIGIIYMWISKKEFPSKKKIILTIVSGLWFLIILGSTNMSTNDTPSDIPTTNNVTKQQTKDADNEEKQKKNDTKKKRKKRKNSIGTSDNDINDLIKNISVMNVRNDETDNYRCITLAEDTDFLEYALSYYNTYFKDDKEIHAIVNFTNNTTTKISVIDSNTLDITIHEYVDGEEHDAKLMYSGMVDSQYFIYMDNGDIEKI